MASTSIEATELFVRTIADVALQNEKYFADLDGVCGDGDFGISLAAGFSKVMEQWGALDRSAPGAGAAAVRAAKATRAARIFFIVLVSENRSATLWAGRLPCPRN